MNGRRYKRGRLLHQSESQQLVMMKMMTTKAVLLFLALVLAAVRADVNSAEVTGSWATQAVASDNPSKTGDGGPLRPFFRTIDCAGAGCQTITLSFYTKEAGRCVLHTVVGEKGSDGNYQSEYSGQNYYHFLVQKPGFIVFYNHNVDANGQDTHMTVALAQGGQLSDTQSASYADVTDANSISRGSIQQVASHEKQIPMSTSELTEEDMKELPDKD
ncbi:female-specific lacrimal gland protein-like [Ochotona curzoniae]|uniref:female-specific lacrimal gland protein-like n=1 Tax=Ochotona curzoniae TaxID=130825 RepID=UPI001B34B574|nr:female-specific lacrimal gland protein-like [Ochotona curzoniae]